MKTSREELLQYISEDLIIYLKSGKLSLNPFIRKLNLNIHNIHQLLKVHFLLQSDVREYILGLPERIRRFKTSTKSINSILFGEIRGQINWPKTLESRCNTNIKDKTIFLCDERNRYYSIKENLILKEFIKTLYRIILFDIDYEKLSRYDWFVRSDKIKRIIRNIYEKNIYLKRIEDAEGLVTDRMIEDTVKSRNPLYSEAAKLLRLYRRLMNFDLYQDEVYRLLSNTFINIADDNTLFEFYWVFRLIKENAISEKLYVIDEGNNKVASWEDEVYFYDIYHNSTGSNELTFQVLLEELEHVDNEYAKRKVMSLKKAGEIVSALFGSESYDFKSIWSGRPDILVEVINKNTSKLEKLIIGEVKYTQNDSYVIQGLKELVEYTMFVKKRGEYIYGDGSIGITGMLFTDRIKYNPIVSEEYRIVSVDNEEPVLIAKKAGEIAIG
jgi:hypothetical protein